jgi:tRNA (guanine-N(7)-)-methyltransferase
MKYKKDYDINLLEDVIKYDHENIVQTNSGRPVIVEIGCGNGHFLINKAVENVGNDYFGIDRKSDRLIRCREKEVKHGIKNVKWMHGDAFDVLKDMFDDFSISGIYMLFPDPWPKRKHHKKRLFKNDFADIIFKKLAAKGFFIFVTDFADYYVEVCGIISSDPRFEVTRPDNLDDFSISLFGERWQKENRTYHILVFGKKNDR